MSDERDQPALARFVRKLRGGSQAVLAEASDGLQYVVKFGNQPQGPNVLFNESMGTELYRHSRLLVPAWRALIVTHRFVDENRGCWIETAEGSKPPNTGLCFGSCYLGGLGFDLYELLPASRYRRVRNRLDFWLAWLLDVCANHADNRQAVFVQGFDGRYGAAFIDHGHMFGGPKGDRSLPFTASAYLDRRIYPVVGSKEARVLCKQVLKIDHDRLWSRAQALPAEWRTGAALAKLSESLSILSCSTAIENTLAVLMIQQRQVPKYAENDEPLERKPDSSVLRSGVPRAAVGGLAVA